MLRQLASFASIVVLVEFASPLAIAQDTFRYDFDGIADEDPQPDDPTDWMTSVNWSDGGFDPNEAFGPLLPDLDTRVEIENSVYGENAPVIGPGDEAQAGGIRIGRFGGPGELTMSGGTLDLADHCTVSPFTCSGDSNTRLRVGNADVIEEENRHPGTFNLSGGTVNVDTLWIGSGSHGEMNMSGGQVNTRGNLYFDWTSDLTYDTNSVLNMSGGTIHVGTTFAAAGKFRMYRLSSLNLEGGEILVDGTAELGTETGLNEDFTQTPNVTVSITGGLLETQDFLQIGGSVTLDGGILRAESFNEILSIGSIDINGTGLLQFQNSMESVEAVEALISSGVFTTSEATPLTVEVVDVDGVDFTQVSIAATVGLPGDYNENGEVDAADYTVWRDMLGQSIALPNEDPGTTPGMVTQEDYDFWVSVFGDSSVGSGALTAAAIPEPATFVYCLVALLAVARFRRKS